MSIFKRLVSAVLAVVLLAGMMAPIPVHAEETETIPPAVTEETAASTVGITAPAAETTVSTEETTISTAEPTVFVEETTVPATEATAAAVETTAPIQETTVPATVPAETEAAAETTPAMEATQSAAVSLEESLVASGTCGEAVTWTLDEAGTLTISGVGAMEDYWGSYYTPWSAYRYSISSLVIEEGVTTVGNSALELCESLSSVTLPEGLTTIGESAFADSAIETITIPASVTSIATEAFADCSALRTIHFLGDAPSIDSSAFCVYWDPEVTKTAAVVFYPVGNTTWTDEVKQNYGGILVWAEEGAEAPVAIGQCGRDLYWSLSADGVLTLTGSGAMKNYDYASQLPWYSYRADITQVVFPEGATNVGRYGFCGAENLVSVTLPETVTQIGAYSFENCRLLPGIVLPDAVTSIGDYAFYNCRALESVTMGENVTSIGNYAFHYTPWYAAQTVGKEFVVVSGTLMEYLGSDMVVEIPASVTAIGSRAFEENTQLESVILPEGVTSIGDYAFEECSALKSITLPSTLKSIGCYAFRDCASLTGVTLPEGIQSIDEYAFTKCTSLTEIVLPDSLTSLGYSAFLYCTGLKSIHIGAGLRALENNLFEGCTSLTAVEIPYTITVIKSGAFNGCTKLADVTFQEAVATLGGGYDNWDDPWTEDTEDTTVYPDPGTYLEIQWKAFGDCTALTEVYLPSHLSNLASTAFQGSTNTTHYYVNSTYYVNDDSGAIYQLSNGVQDTLVCVPARISGKLVIPETVTNVYADFYGCSQLTSITFSSGAGGVRGNNAFYGCTSLTEIIAGSENTSGYYNDEAGALLWENYGSAYICALPADLTEYTVPADVSYIYAAGFSNAPLTALYVEEGSAYYASQDGVLFNADGTTLVKYPGAKAGTSYVVPAAVTDLSEYAFGRLKELEEIWFCGDSLYVNSYSFEQGTTLTAYYPQNLWDPGYVSELGYMNSDILQWKPYTLVSVEDGGICAIETDVPFAIRPTRDISGLKSVQLDGKTVAASNYVTSASGNMVIFQTSWLNSLEDVEHTFLLQFTDGSEEVSTGTEASAATAELEALLADAALYNKWVHLTKPVVLTKSLTISNCNLTIGTNGHLTVPDGITLSVNGYLSVENGGKLDVQAGGCLINNESIYTSANTPGGYIHVDGSYVGSSGWFNLQVSNGNVPEVTGVDKQYLSLNAYEVDTDEALLQVLSLQDQGYGEIYISIEGQNITLNQDVTIGKNTRLSVYPDYSAYENTTLTLNGNTLLEGELYIGEYADYGIYGVVRNNGTLTIASSGKLDVRGQFLGNEPVLKALTQDELEAQLAAAAQTGSTVQLRVPIVLERDLTLNCGLNIQSTGHLTVPSGVTLTIDRYVSVSGGGKLDVQAGGKLINNRGLSIYDTADSYIHVNGTYIHGEDAYMDLEYTDGLPDVTGINRSYQGLNFYNADEAAFLQAIAMQDQGYQSIWISTADLELNTDVTIGKDTTLSVQSSYSDSQRGLIINSNVILEGRLYVSAYPENDVYGIVQNNGTLTITRTGSLDIRGIFQGNEPIFQGPDQTELEQLLRSGGEVELNTPLVLERDLTIPENCCLYISGSGKLTVPSGITLTINDQLSISSGGKLDVEAGGKLVNNGYLSNWDTYSNGYIHINGTYTHGKYGYVNVSMTPSRIAEVTGIDQSYWNVDVYDVDEAGLLYALSLEDAGYQSIWISVSSLVLNTDITIGENISLGIQPNYNGNEVGLINNASITVKGSMYVQAYDGRVGTVQNNGKITVSKGGYLLIEGTFLGNAPINGGGYIIDESGSQQAPEPIEIVEQDMTVDACMVSGVTLTVTPQSNHGITWKSSNKNIVDPNAIVSNGDGTFFVPFAYKALGNVTLTAINGNDSSTKDTITLTVSYLDTAKKLTASADIPTIGLQCGETAQMLVFGSDAENALAAGYLTFSSSNEDVAAVNEAGVITAGTKTGTAKITAAIQNDPLKRNVTLSVKVIAPQTRTLSLLDDAGAELTALSFDLADLGQKSYTFHVSPNPGYAEGVSAPALSKSSFKWTSSDTKLATVKANTDGSADVTIKAGAYGVCTITAQTNDLAKITASFQLQVMDRSPRLGSDSVTLNPLLDTGAALTLVTSYDNTILADGITIADSRLQAQYDSQQGVLTIRALETLRNGTIKTTLDVPCQDGRVYTYDLKVSVKAQAPSVTVKQTGKLDLFYEDSEASITATAKNASVKDLTLADTQDFQLTYDGEHGILTFSDSYLAAPTGKPDTKATLEIWLEGYAQPVTKSFSIGTTSTKLSLTTDPASSSINTALSDDYLTTFRVYNKKTGEVLKLTDGDIEAVEATYPGLYRVTDDGQVALCLTDTYGGTATIYLKLDGWAQSVKLTHKISVSTSLPTVKLGTSTLKLSSIFTGQTAVSSVSLSQGNLSIGSFGEDNVFTPTANAAEADKIQVYYDGSDIVAKFRDPQDLPKNGTYSYTAVPVVEGRELKAVTVKVNVSNKEPKVKLASTLKLNTLLTGGETAAAAVSLNNSTGYDLTVVDFLGMDAHSENVDLYFDAASGELRASLKSDAAAKYVYTLTPVVRDDSGADTALSSTVKLTVQAKSAKVSVSQSASGKLDLMVPESKVVYTVKRISNAIGAVTGVTLLDAAGQESDLFLVAFDEEAQSVTLTMDPDRAYSTKETYKVKLRYTICGAAVDSSVLSIKVTQSKLKLTAERCQYFQSQTIPMLVKVSVASPAGARIGTIEVNAQKTSKELLAALGADDALVFQFPEGTGEAALQLDVKHPGQLTAGKSYTLYLNVTSAVPGSTPVEVKVSVTVSR